MENIDKTITLKDIEPLSQYITSVTYSLISVDRDLFFKQIHEEQNQKTLLNFASNDQNKTLTIAKDSTEEGLVYIQTQMTENDSQRHSIAFIKRQKFVVQENQNPNEFAKTIQVINLGYCEQGINPIKINNLYMQNCFIPLFSVYRDAMEARNAPEKDDYQVLLKKIKDLQLTFNQCQNEVDIPEIRIYIEPKIQDRVNKLREEGKKLQFSEEEFKDLLTDDFVNQLTEGVQRWIQDIKSVFSTSEKSDLIKSTFYEVNFWQSYERNLNMIQQQINSSEVGIIIEILDYKKKQFVTSVWNYDLNFTGKLKKAINYNNFTKDLPLNDLLSSQELSDILQAIEVIFIHLKRLNNHSDYSNDRSSILLELITTDVNNQIIQVLRQKKLKMNIETNKFLQITQECEEIYDKWNEYIKAIVQQLSPNDKNKLKNLCITKPVFFQKFKQYRRLHEKLKTIIQDILNKKNLNMKGEQQFMNIEEVEDAYTVFDNIDVLDTSIEGENALNQAIINYEVRIEKVEKKITSHLTDKLVSTQNATEMFNIFDKFNQLFFRQRIKAAIQQYQQQLLKTVSDDIDKLKTRYFDKYVKSQNFLISNVRDIPQYTGETIWKKQMIKKLKKHLQRVEQVLGENWHTQSEGQQCKQQAEELIEQLQIDQSKFFQWQEDKSTDIRNRLQQKIFKFEQKKKINIVISFDPTQNSLQKECQMIKQYLEDKNETQFDKERNPLVITQSIQRQTDNLVKMYPYAVCLQEAIHTYNQTDSIIDATLAPLVSSFREKIHKQIQKGMSYYWNSNQQLEPYSKEFSKCIYSLEEAANFLALKNGQINLVLANLKNCNIEYIALNKSLSSIQNIIDDFVLKKFSNLQQWVTDLNVKVEQIFHYRIEGMIQSWIEEFKDYKELDRSIILVGYKHELKMKNSQILIEPPIEYARYFWFREFHKYIGVICSLPKLSYNSDGTDQNEYEQDYSYILYEKLDQKKLQSAYETINKIMLKAEKCVQTWLSYTNLWNIDVRRVYDMLEDDIDKWQQMLDSIKKGRSTIDKDDSEVFFGAIQIEYRKIQSKISDKYDAWHKEILNHFGELFGNKVRNFSNTISKSRDKLERINFQNVGDDLKLFITDLNNVKQSYPGWSALFDSFESGYKLLEKQRYIYPQDWVELEYLRGKWSSFCQVYKSKNQSLEKETTFLQQKIISDGNQLDIIIKEIETQWNNEKPDSGDLMPTQALDILNMLRAKLNRVKDDYIQCCNCKELLNLEPGNPEKLEDFEVQMSGLREVWTEMQKIWNNIDDLKDKTLDSVSTQAIKDCTDSAMRQLSDLPVKLQSYEAYDKMKERIGHYAKQNNIIIDLKSEAVKPKHWKQLLKRMKIEKQVSELTLQFLWEKNLLTYEKFCQEVMTVATGELVLENMLQGIKDQWDNYEMDLVRYQAKCKLIRGWDELFTQLDEDLNNLSSMKISPYYKAFQEQVEPCDERLQRYRITLDIWIDVQRRWVYLESIFFGSSDIKQQLSNEYTRFQGIDREFVSLHKKVANKPFIRDVMSIDGLQKTLERLADLLSKIQKALGEYLEMQRQAFARFYFLGDEDLLEIIGNSKDVKAVQRHFNKMYAGIISLNSEKRGEDDLILAMNSKEGETVTFSKEVNITEDPRINVWLTKVDEQMMFSLASQLEQSLQEVMKIQPGQEQDLLGIIEKFPAQVILLSLQVLWCNKIEAAFENQGLQEVVDYIVKFLSLLAALVVKNLKKDLRQKYEQIITDFVHQRDVSRELINSNVTSNKDFGWQYYMRFNWQPKEEDVLKKLQIKMARAQFYYGFEYLGVAEKLVQTPLTDRCYVTLTQALHMRMGGNPNGPAGTGKTESVKALGSQLGQFVLVFNCDETFDFHAMGRIFVGLCQVGAWGCFDEFNRLEERMLSAVSQQILIIQQGLRERQKVIHLMNRDVKLNFSMGIFVTMNPGYAGRSNLPENLKQLFRQMAMVKPDRELIAQVMLYSQGFTTAERLAGKIVSLFELCNDQLSSQPHYDFGLRALKSVLVSSGNMKRFELQQLTVEITGERELREFEEKILLRSVCETIVPKLIADDVPLLQNLMAGIFPGSSIQPIQEEELVNAMKQIAKERHYMLTEPFLQKMLQLYQIQKICHGVMLVGPSGVGKSAAWKILLEAMYRVSKVPGQSYIIDPVAIHKDDLYGKLDNTTMEWTDGVFTGVLRKIIENQRGESGKIHWIFFDGDVNPVWAENLNSVLDDNKLLTLPNGERLSIPPNVRIMFEVETLKYATLATVSRCGMVWFSEDLVSQEMIHHHYLNRLMQQDFDHVETDPKKLEEKQETQEDFTRKECVQVISQYFEGNNSFVQQCVDIASKHTCVMEFTVIRVLEAMFALIRKGISNVIDYNESNSDLPLDSEVLRKYMQNWTLFSICWGISGSMTLKERQIYSDEISQISPITPPPKIPGCESIIDYEVSLEKGGEFLPWKKKVPTIEIDPQKVTDADIIITTVDTLRHQEVLCSWLSEHRPFILCGPPGSGKTMTLMSTLKQLPDFEMIFINFSSGTYPSLILQQFEQYCEYVKTTNGIVLKPKTLNKWLVVFCDEINLPEQDAYGTMAVITFLRELTEQKGFWRPQDKQWVTLERIQFIGACNPPTDVGRNPLNPRFLRHCPLILVDFPGTESLKQIYGTFNKAMMKRVPHLKMYTDCLTNAMVEFYSKSQNHFTSDIQSHYIYSPRELTRWKFAINEALDSVETQENLVRLWAHEALRLFYDRLVKDEEKDWCEKLIDEVAVKNFPQLNIDCLERPILFSNYLTKSYVSCDREQLRQYIQARMKTFNEEQLDVQMVVFDSVIDHILRIDRVLRQPLGHLLLVGSSGVGKTTLSRFVSWMNNLTVFQIKAGRKYSLADFDVDLREVMKRAGVKGEKITFIFDESNVLSPAFLEKMNALLASGEIPGLFEGDEYLTLMTQCKEAAQKDHKMVDTEDQIYKNFIRNVQRNLHVVFTMNPNNPDFSNRTASSPALFNRCVIDWFGDWSDEAFTQVAKELTRFIDPADESFTKAKIIESSETKGQALVGAIVHMHKTVQELNDQLKKSAKKFNYITTRDFLDFLKHFEQLFISKSEQLADQQRHLSIGLDKLKETEQQVIEMQATLSGKKIELDKKEREATEKLKLMVQEKTIAGQSKDESIALSKQVDIKKIEIQERSEKVNHDLEQVLPMLESAKQAVSNINQNDLKFIQALGKPPALIQFTVAAVIAIIKNTDKEMSWAELVKEIKDKQFIPTIMNYNTDNLKAKVRQHVDKTYINNKAWVIADINRASKAAGPLAEWCDSQLKFGRILQQVDPLRAEVKRLEEEEQALSQKKVDLDTKVNKLEAKIDALSKDYEILTSEKERIKNDMESVKQKCERSENLIKNLSSERHRWDGSCQNFKSQQATLVGDALLAGSFSSYIGFFDHYYRKVLNKSWRHHLENGSYINYRKDLEMIEYLSVPSERLIWQSHGLPSDDLCTENSIIMNRYRRYPLVIDPSGQALSFIQSFYKDKKINTSSFADEGFIKNLETCLRFGFPLLVQDVEKIDPILNSVLNKESYKTGGRVLIRVGDQEIDFSPNFQMFMITRDSNATFTPDLCSRVTFINFTVTKSSLENQCLNAFMKNETPAVEEDRIKLMKLQGEFVVKLRELEDKLLDALNSAQGSILENDKVISTLETLKNEATEVQKQMDESETIMNGVKKVTEDYRPLAQACSSVFFALADMATVHYLYQFKLSFFMDIFQELIQNNANLQKIDKKELQQRRQCIKDELFIQVYQRTVNSILINDRLIFAMKLAQIKLGSQYQQQYQQMIKDSQLLESTISETLLAGKLNKVQLKQVEELSQIYPTVIQHIQQNEGAWLNFYQSGNPETEIPQGWEPQDVLQEDSRVPQKDQQIRKIIRNMQIIKIFRGDRFNVLSRQLVELVCGEGFMNETQVDMKQVTNHEASPNTPLLMCSSPGFDPSFRVEALSKEVGTRLMSVAIGSAEGFIQAEKAIQQASKNGVWVMLKNVHLAPQWLAEVEKTIHQITPHPNFRLFLTMEFNPKVPSTLIRQCYKLVFEPPSGIKASLYRAFKTVLTPNVVDKAPRERGRLHFLVAWLHSVLLERLRFTPTGYTKTYEFNEADQRCALDLINEYIDNMGDRSNIDPAQIPWEAIKTVLTHTLYGAKIDNEYDSMILSSLVDNLFSEKSYDVNHSLFTSYDKGVNEIKVPEGSRQSQFLEWIDNLPNVESPNWSGLPANVEKILKEQQANRVLEILWSLQDVNEEQISDIEIGGGQKKQKQETQLQWLKDLDQKVDRFLQILPKDVEREPTDKSNINNPLYRFLDREITVAKKTLKLVLQNLEQIKQMCSGEILPSQQIRKLAQDVYQDHVPAQWLKQAGLNLKVTEWIIDFKKRIEQFTRLSKTPNFQQSGVELGKLIYPEAFMTATRQYVCEIEGSSLDELELQGKIYDGSSQIEKNSFLIKGVNIEGADWDANTQVIKHSNEITTPIKAILFSWIKRESKVIKLQDSDIMVPVYLNNMRKQLVFSLRMNRGELSRNALYQKAVALIAWNE